MLPLPFLNAGFIALTFFTAYLFYRLTGSNNRLLLTFAGWLALHAGLALAGFYAVTDTLPPRVALALVPALLAGAMVGFSPLGKSLRKSVDLEQLHYLHAVRIVAEVVFLHGLYEAGYVARVGTYAGQNWDILAGLTGPLIALLVFRWRKLPRAVAFSWNIAGILLLGWTISRAVLSAPSGYQQYGFEQPTVAIFYFPFIWLPALVAPLMIWAHFIALGRVGAG